MRVTCGTWRLWAALTLTLTTCDSARAFYWHEWPGSRARVQETLITQQARVTGGPPVEPAPLGPPVPIAKPPVGPNPTPEPATGLLGLLGLGALAAAKRWRRSGK